MSQPKGRGVLPINAAATRKSNKSGSRAPTPRLRLIIRRLPPGLTESEFWDTIGPDWHVGAGKVDWAVFNVGKISKDLAKPSRPARAYMRVKDQSFLDQLSLKVRQTVFQDAKNTIRDPCLIGPPSLEFAPYTKVPNGRVRHDGRQGTIDQDPEFIDFLQSLTEPIVKAANGAEVGETKKDDITITPLVQYIKEKKANKAKEKEAAATKASKKQEQKEAKASSSKLESRSKVVVKSKSSQNEKEKDRVAKTTSENIQPGTRSSSSIPSKGSSAKRESKSPSKEATTPVQTPSKRERQRGDATVAARMVARDLGLTPKERKSSKTQSSQTAATGSEPTVSQKSTSNTKSATPPTPAQPSNTTTAPTPSSVGKIVQPPTGPKSARQPSQSHKQPVVAASAKSQKSNPQPSPGAKSAFLKHANPSQGVTEELLRTTFGVYGSITRCEIDKKKGLGYIDFTEPDALKNAMAASPVKIGNGQVTVLENRSPYKKGGGNATNHGRESNSKAPSVSSPATSAASSPKPAVATPAVTQPLANVIEMVGNTTPGAANVAARVDDGLAAPDSISTSENTNPPVAPRGGRSGGRGHRGGRGFRGRGRGGGRGSGNAGNNSQSTGSGGGETATSAATTNAAGNTGA